MTCPHQSHPPGKDTGRRLCAIGRFDGRPWLGNCQTCNQTPGPGTVLKSILGRFGITSTTSCPCTARAAEMDRRGPDWCEANLATITGWLKMEATRRHLPFSSLAAAALIRGAIRKSRRLQGILQPGYNVAAQEVQNRRNQARSSND